MKIYVYAAKRKVKRKIIQILHFNKLYLKYPIVIKTLDRQKKSKINRKMDNQEKHFKTKTKLSY